MLVVSIVASVADHHQRSRFESFGYQGPALDVGAARLALTNMWMYDARLQGFAETHGLGLVFSPGDGGPLTVFDPHGLLVLHGTPVQQALDRVAARDGGAADQTPAALIAPEVANIGSITTTSGDAVKTGEFNFGAVSYRADPARVVMNTAAQPLGNGYVLVAGTTDARLVTEGFRDAGAEFIHVTGTGSALGPVQSLFAVAGAAGWAVTLCTLALLSARSFRPRLRVMALLGSPRSALVRLLVHGVGSILAAGWAVGVAVGSAVQAVLTAVTAAPSVGGIGAVATAAIVSATLLALLLTVAVATEMWGCRRAVPC